MSARVEAIEAGSNRAEYCMIEGKRGCVLKGERVFDGSYPMVAGTGSTIRMNDSHPYRVRKGGLNRDTRSLTLPISLTNHSTRLQGVRNYRLFDGTLPSHGTASQNTPRG